VDLQRDLNVGEESRYRYQLSWNTVNDAESSAIDALVLDAGGGWGKFSMFEWDPHPLAENMGQGDGTTTVYDIPAKQATGIVMLVDGVSKTFTLSSGAGANGRDRVTMTVAPGAGLNIAVTATSARRYVTCVLENDGMDWTDTDASLSVGTLPCVEVIE